MMMSFGCVLSLSLSKATRVEGERERGMQIYQEGERQHVSEFWNTEGEKERGREGEGDMHAKIRKCLKHNIKMRASFVGWLSRYIYDPMMSEIP